MNFKRSLLEQQHLMKIKNINRMEAGRNMKVNPGKLIKCIHFKVVHFSHLLA